MSVETWPRQDILQLKSYQDEWDRTQRAIELAKREQVAKEAGGLHEPDPLAFAYGRRRQAEIRQRAASRAAELLAERGDLEDGTCSKRHSHARVKQQRPCSVQEEVKSEPVITMNLFGPCEGCLSLPEDCVQCLCLH